jgi:hypothetical protein
MTEGLKEKQVKHQGKLDLGGFEIDCYVGEDGERYFSEEGMKTAIDFLFDKVKINCEECGVELPTILDMLKEITLKNLERPRLVLSLLGEKYLCEPHTEQMPDKIKQIDYESYGN